MQSLFDDFPNTPLVAVLYLPNSVRYFGAFANGLEAIAWLNQQPPRIEFAFIPLRSPNIVRSYDDFYNPQKDYDEEEFNHQQPTAKEKPAMSNNTKPVGAHCIIQWYDSGIEEEQYISFGEYDPEVNEDFDSLGQRDDSIFFYCEGGVDELKGLMNLYMSTSHEDFVVKSYELEYAS